MRIIAVLDVDEKKLAETGHSFEEEMGWVAQSGIALREFAKAEKCGEYEYAAFAWNTELNGYEQMGRAVLSELLCRNRFEEYVKKGWFRPCYNPEKVLFKKRLVSTIHTKWEAIE